jgi:hypothetical protein
MMTIAFYLVKTTFLNGNRYKNKTLSPSKNNAMIFVSKYRHLFQIISLNNTFRLQFKDVWTLSIIIMIKYP